MVSWIYDYHNDIYIGSLSDKESKHVKDILTKHGNHFRETNYMLISSGVIICSYENFIKQAEGEEVIGERGKDAIE